MAFKNLSAEEMLGISGTWIDPTTAAYQAILANSELKGSLPRILLAHTGVAAAAQPPLNARLAALIEEEASIDARHDTIIRGSFGQLTSMAELVGGVVGVALITLRDWLFPDGLSSQIKSYRAEVGQANQLAARLTPAITAQTAAIMIGQAPNAVSLTAYLEEMIGLARQLGVLEDEKGTILAAQTEASAGATLLTARNFWVRVLNAMVSNAALAELSSDVDAVIFGSLRDGEKRADERARVSGKSAKAAAEKAAAEKVAAEKAEAEKAKATTPVSAGPAGTG